MAVPAAWLSRSVPSAQWELAAEHNHDVGANGERRLCRPHTCSEKTAEREQPRCRRFGLRIMGDGAPGPVLARALGRVQCCVPSPPRDPLSSFCRHHQRHSASHPPAPPSRTISTGAANPVRCVRRPLRQLPRANWPSPAAR
jgi:hypothetical protein